MANVLSLAMKINADASGFKLDPVQRALIGLGQEADKLTGVFDKFKGSSEAAGRAQEQFAKQSQELLNALRDGGSATQFAADFERLAQSAREQAAAIEEGVRVTESVRTAEERRATELERLDRLLQQNAITEETYNRAKDEASGANEAAATAERQRQALLDEGASLTDRLRTAEERRAAELSRIEELLSAGAISEQTASRARAEASGANAAAAQAEKDQVEALAAAQRERDKLLQDGVRITQQFATVEERRATQIAELDRLLARGAITEETYARALAEASGASKAAADAAKEEADALEAAERQRQSVLDEGRRITEQYRTVEEKRAAELERIGELLRQGAISEETAARAKAQASGANEAAAAAERERADALAAASRIIQANLTPQERYDAQMQALRVHLDAGRLSQEQFNRAASKAQDDLNNAGRAASNTEKNIESLTKNVRLLSAIEIGRVLIDGLQVLGGVFQQVTGEITSLVASVNSSLDTLNDFSARTGIGVEALQGYSLAAKLAGVDTEQFGITVQKLGVSIGKANTGDAFDKSLRGIGLSVAELRALAPEQQFSAIGEAISQLPTAADRAAAAVKIFGEQGAALAPLFREGAASIDELRERAEKLGIIVSEQQVANVAAMNDAFDLVSATVQGIIGQVVGNLAPAVTAVVDEFLQFVEEWSGAQGSGGTGIANAITDSLLDAADYFADVFDFFTRNLEGISSSLDDVAEVFRIGGQLLLTGAEGFRTIFNVIQIGIDALLIGLGKVLEGIGSWVSDDLEQFGAGLAAASQESADRNAREMEAAATNAANAFSRIFDDVGNNAEQAGEGAASRLVGGIRNRIQQERTPEFRIESNVETLRERFDNLFEGLVDQSSTVTTLMQEFEQALAAAQQDGQLTADEIERIETLQARVNSAIDEEARVRKEAADAAQAQADAVQSIVDRELENIRIQNEFGGDEARAKNVADLQKVRDEIAKTEQQIAEANARGDEEAAARASARLAQLDQVEARLADAETKSARRADETAQGFADGFDKAFEATTRGLNDLIAKAAGFGNEGAKAAQQLQEGVARAQQQVRDGILSQAAYQAEVANQRKLAEQRLAQLERERQAQQQAQQEAFQRQVDANNRVQEYLKSLVTDRARLEAEEFEKTNNRKIEAAQNLKAIEDQIATQQRSVQAAREAGDLKAAKARQAELDALKKLKAAEQNIVDGKAAANQQINTAALASANAQAAQQQQFANAARQQVGQLQSAASNAIGLTNEAFAKAAERQQKLLNDLNTLGSRTVQTADARTAEGAAIVLGLAADAQDPRLIEQRLANKVLKEIAVGLTQNLNRIGIPAVLA